MNVSNKHFRKLRVTSSDIEYLKSLKDLPISYLVSSQNISTVITHVGTVPVASGLSTHVNIIFFLCKMA